jgi:hypothetical protein
MGFVICINFFLRFGGTMPLFFIYVYIYRVDIQYLYILLVEYPLVILPSQEKFKKLRLCLGKI